MASTSTEDSSLHLLFCTTTDQQAYLQRFSRLACLQGHRVSVMETTPQTLSELEFKCKKAGVEGILLANQPLLTKALNGLADFKPPTSTKALSLEDYQGSLISIKGIETVVLSPPEQLMSVPYGAYVTDRFIKKLTQPTAWFPQTEFVWSVFDPATVEEIFNQFNSSGCRVVGVDIETPLVNPRKAINCISFTGYFPATHTTYSLVIPFTDTYHLSWIRKFCEIPAPKVLQGGTYDAAYLLRFACPLYNWLYDTLNLFHSWYSELPKRLDFVSAFSLRRIRYWKDDGKTGDLHDYYRYNAMDGWATVNSLLSLLSELPAWAIENYKQEFPLVFPSIHCELEGWRVDPETFLKVRAEQQAIVSNKLASIRKMLKAPNYNPGSWQQNKKVFQILGCGDLPSTNEANMKKAEFRHPLNARVIGDMRDYKKSKKLVSTYCDEEKLWKLGEKNWRLFYRLNPAATDTGRLASTESSFWLGYQIQNIKRGPTIKQYLWSDPGWELAEPDASQAESRATFYLAGEQKGIDVVESGKDFHCYNATLFFGFKYEDLWDEKLGKCKTPEAQAIRDEPAKRTNHGANYNMSGGVMLDTVGPKVAARMKTLLKLPALMSLKDVCQHCLNIWSRTYPKVKGLYYETTIKTIELTKKLVSPLGWTRHFFGDPKGNKHYLNVAVAHGPQNLSVGIINRGFYKIWWESIYGVFRNHLRLKAQIHDSIPYQYKIGSEWVNDRVQQLLTLPVKVVGADKVTRTMVIPIAMKAGKHQWSALK